MFQGLGRMATGARLRALRTDMDDFILEFLNLTERNFT